MADVSFQRIGEVEVDSRRRISLGRLGKKEHTRYAVEENEHGELRLVPLATIPARELEFWNNPDLVQSMGRALEQASRGELVDRGSFAQYLEDDDDEATS